MEKSLYLRMLWYIYIHTSLLSWDIWRVWPSCSTLIDAYMHWRTPMHSWSMPMTCVTKPCPMAPWHPYTHNAHMCHHHFNSSHWTFWPVAFVYSEFLYTILLLIWSPSLMLSIEDKFNHDNILLDVDYMYNWCRLVLFRSCCSYLFVPPWFCVFVLQSPLSIIYSFGFVYYFCLSLLSYTNHLYESLPLSVVSINIFRYNICGWCQCLE